ncbi:hypothetical protein [Prevotella sp. P3-122]|uniref:hypothetical protein n=1 Tax=Prevotella sp. P3-122 TaxID=2024223 RepID=UPI001F0B4869|nr:hypothetical protein [Prevotella sp. P3-122]
MRRIEEIEEIERIEEIDVIEEIERIPSTLVLRPSTFVLRPSPSNNDNYSECYYEAISYTVYTNVTHLCVYGTEHSGIGTVKSRGR